MEVELFFLGIFAFIVIILAILMVRNRIIFKMGFRNILRRKGNTAIVILGLMVGTAVISSSLVIGDTMNNMIETEVLEYYHTTDEKIVAVKPTGERDYFNESIFYEIEKGFSLAYIDGLSPAIHDSVAILDMKTNLSEPTVIFIGIDFSHAENFGAFINQDRERITKLADNEIMIGKNTAEEIDAEVGDAIVVFASNNYYPFTLTHILQPKERAGNGEGIFVNLSTAQKMLNKHGKINQILVSNKGGVYEGMDYSNEVKEEFEKIRISDGLEYKMVEIKKDVLENNKEGMKQFTDMFLVFGTFSIIAGVILIINIFVMLAEERKSEMGMARAIGMKRKHLKRMYLSEGTIYALIASLLGVFFGIGIGFLIIFALEEIFKSFGVVNILQYFT
ncbi:MAG: ABC transporter permease, partial [Thermoplasmatales archaeon]|nr:ABC transporter permease [Thermoplasmatales archaeon]